MGMLALALALVFVFFLSKGELESVKLEHVGHFGLCVLCHTILYVHKATSELL